jgi:hypothetical protein
MRGTDAVLKSLALQPIPLVNSNAIRRHLAVARQCLATRA